MSRSYKKTPARIFRKEFYTNNRRIRQMSVYEDLPDGSIYKRIADHKWDWEEGGNWYRFFSKQDIIEWQEDEYHRWRNTWLHKYDRYRPKIKKAYKYYIK